VPQPTPAASLMREEGEKWEQRRERSHRPRPSRKRAKEKGKRGNREILPRRDSVARAASQTVRFEGLHGQFWKACKLYKNQPLLKSETY
jgi:hypothetical protein